jgi:hypothetical protein
VSLPALAFVSLTGDAAPAVARVPAGPGVGQILGPGGTSLLLATASHLRKWAASHLGLGKPAAPGRRPKTNLASLATAIGWVEADAPFRQRLLYERLAAPLVPLCARRDLEPPAFLHLDPAHRFPRVTVRGACENGASLFGPFCGRRAAEKARVALHRLFPLRPCDYAFEPDPTLPLGMGCLYAQVWSCAAPCLARVSEEAYRSLATRAAAWLTRPSAREEAPPAVPATVAAVEGTRAVIVDAGRSAVGLYPVRQGRVLEHAAVSVLPGGLDAAVSRLDWPEPAGPGDWPWLAAWLRSPRGRASYVLAGDGNEALATAVRAALPARFAAPTPGGNVEAAQGGA